MSGFAVLLLAAAASALGVYASLKSRPPLVPAVIAALLFAFAGVAAVLASWIAGDGIVFPGIQLSPGLVAYYMSEQAWGLVPWVSRGFLAAAPVAHLLLLAVRRNRAALLLPLPATAVFVWLFLAIGTAGKEAPEPIQARGPDKVAYLTILPHGDGARLVIAAGAPFAAFLKVLHVQEAGRIPPPLTLHWTRDGKGLVVKVKDVEDPSFAVDLEGDVTGGLPSEAREWATPPDFVPPDVSRRFSVYRKDTSKFIQAHKGLLPP
jgi:hypothetical protein